MENSFFFSLGAWNWFILAAILGVFEVTLPGFLLIWFGLAALLGWRAGLRHQHELAAAIGTLCPHRPWSAGRFQPLFRFKKR